MKVKVPKLGETVERVLIIEWSVATGSHVQEGDSLMMVETDKVDSEVPSPVTGVLVEQCVHHGDEVDVGATIAVIETQ